MLARIALGAHLEAAPAVRLHVSHPADGLDLGLVGSPVVPVLVRPHFKDILVTTVARVLVAHPAEKVESSQEAVLLVPRSPRYSGRVWMRDEDGMDLRSSGHLKAGNTVLETVRPQAWNILITHLHLTALKIWAFKQANLVILRVLRDIKSESESG